MEKENSPISGLGVDIVEVKRMEKILQRTPSFAEKVFSEGERDYCESKHRPAVHYAMRFAAKEAVVKALGTGFSDGVKVTDIEVVLDEKGRPHPKLYGRAAQIAQDQGVLEMHLSLSRTMDTAVANAVAVTESNRVKEEESKPSAKEELAAAFKELRGMLDDLERQMDAPVDEPEEGEAEENGEESQDVS